MHYIVTLHDDDTNARVAFGLEAPDTRTAVQRAVRHARWCRHEHISLRDLADEPPLVPRE